MLHKSAIFLAIAKTTANIQVTKCIVKSYLLLNKSFCYKQRSY